MRAHQQLPCIRMQLTGELVVDFRYSTHPGGAEPETNIWVEVWKRRDPDAALFIDDKCVHKGAFKSEEAAMVKLRAATNGRGFKRPTS